MTEIHRCTHDKDHMPHHIPRGLLRFLILRLLENREMSGREISQTFHERSGGLWRPSPGSLYPVLEGLASIGDIELVSTHGRTKTYRITTTGRAFLREMLDMRSTAVKSRAQTGPKFWLYLLDIQDRIALRLENIDSDLNGLEEDGAGLRETERQELVTRLESIAQHLGTLIDRLKARRSD